MIGLGGYQGEKKKKKNCRPLAAERPAAAMLFVPSTRLFRAKVIYTVLGSSYLSARKIQAIGPIGGILHVSSGKLNTEKIWR